MTDVDCICRGNLRAIVDEHRPLFDKRIFLRSNPERGFAWYTGVLISGDDYYHRVVWEDGKQELLSCVGDLLSSWDFGLAED